MKPAACYLLACAIASAPLMAADLELSILPPDMQEVCKAEGGCHLFSAQALGLRLTDAFNKGYRAGQGTCGRQA